jgi:hypothetical protein
VHPDLLGALARQHHADLLGRHGVGPPRLTSTRPPPVRRPIRRVRHSLGLILVATGQRLLRTTSTIVDLSDVRQ